MRNRGYIRAFGISAVLVVVAAIQFAVSVGTNSSSDRAAGFAILGVAAVALVVGIVLRRSAANKTVPK